MENKERKKNTEWNVKNVEESIASFRSERKAFKFGSGRKNLFMVTVLKLFKIF